MVHSLRNFKRHYINKPPVNEQPRQSTRNCCYSIRFHVTHQTVSQTNSTHSYLCKKTFGGCDERLPSHILHCCRYSLCMHMLINLKWLSLWNILSVVATKFTTHTCCRIWFEKLDNIKCLFCAETMSTCAALADRKGINFQWGFMEDGEK